MWVNRGLHRATDVTCLKDTDPTFSCPAPGGLATHEVSGAVRPVCHHLCNTSIQKCICKSQRLSWIAVHLTALMYSFALHLHTICFPAQSLHVHGCLILHKVQKVTTTEHAAEHDWHIMNPRKDTTYIKPVEEHFIVL